MHGVLCMHLVLSRTAILGVIVCSIGGLGGVSLVIYGMSTHAGGDFAVALVVPQAGGGGCERRLFSSLFVKWAGSLRLSHINLPLWLVIAGWGGCVEPYLPGQ